VHLGIVVVIIGLTGSQAFATERDISLHAGQSATVRGYTFLDRGVYQTSNANEQDVGVNLLELSGHSQIGTLTPAIGYFPASQQRETLVALDSTPLRDVYVVLVAWTHRGWPTCRSLSTLWCPGSVWRSGDAAGGLARRLARAEAAAADPGSCRAPGGSDPLTPMAVVRARREQSRQQDVPA